MKYFRKFYLEYPQLAVGEKGYAVRSESTTHSPAKGTENQHALRDESLPEILYAPRKESWKPGQLHPNLSWTHNRTLLRVDKTEARAFYEIEVIRSERPLAVAAKAKPAAFKTNLSLFVDMGPVKFSSFYVRLRHASEHHEC